MILAQLLTSLEVCPWKMAIFDVAMLLSALWHPCLLGHPTSTDHHRPTQLTQTRRSTQELLQQHEEVADGWLLEHFL